MPRFAAFTASVLVALAAPLLAAASPDREPWQAPDPDTKVAFIADEGVGPGARAVLELIKAEGADLVLHQGDFGYGGGPKRFDHLVTEILGPAFPYFASFGNHDVEDWRIYQAELRARLARIEGAECTGELGIMAACTYKGLFFVFSAVGLPEFGIPEQHVHYIAEHLARSRAIWRVCSWHKTQKALQVENKRSTTGWGVYEACRAGGALIATGHNHSYARTHLIAHFGDTPEVASRGEPLEIAKGRTVAFVSGLGGRGTRPQSAGGPWWASVYTGSQHAHFGALFCTFAPGGESRRAHCYFKTIDGEVPDRFDLVSRLGE